LAAIALALVASLSWGCADFIAGLKSRALSVLAVITISQIAGLTLVAAAVAIRAEGPPGGGFVLFAALSAFAGLSGLAAFYRGLAVGAMAVVAPISGLAAAIPVVFGLIRGEHPSALQAAGMALAIAGVVLASREQAPEQAGGTRTASGVWLAIGAAAGFGFFFVLMDRASDDDVLWAVLTNRITGVALMVALCVALRPGLPTSRSDLLPLVVAGALDMSANGLFAIATHEGLVSVVSVLSSLYPVVVIGLAHFVLRERVRPLQSLGAAGVLAGVALVVAG
jgi:drug/metabolite transporter (DMT)-like permease